MQGVEKKEDLTSAQVAAVMVVAPTLATGAAFLATNGYWPISLSEPQITAAEPIMVAGLLALKPTARYFVAPPVLVTSKVTEVPTTVVVKDTSAAKIDSLMK
jgi:hypothetical protein